MPSLPTPGRKVIEEQAEVVQVTADGVWVETWRRSSCDSCSASGGCGTSVLSKLFGNRSQRLRVLCSVAVQEGDRVVIGLSDEAMVRGSLALYLVPLLGLLLGAVLGEWLAGPGAETGELPVVLGAVAGLGTGLLWLHRFSRRIRHDRRYQPTVLRKV